MPSSPRTRVGSPSQAPAFLQLSEVEIAQKFRDLELKQNKRMAKGITADRESTKWARVSGNDVLNRNRYFNIDPWADNRVHLHVPDGQCDYINASPILMKGSRSEKLRRYIATQGPKESSSQHFWQMIWQEINATGVIVMLTQTHEAGREKCFTYFPRGANGAILDISPKAKFSQGPTKTSHDAAESATSDEDNKTTETTESGFKARVELLETRDDEKTRSIVRKLQLKSGGEEKTVWHYLFEGWPDFSIPEGEGCLALLELAKASGRMAEDFENPRIVHCSAGVGRSGTFIALDYLLSELEEGALDDIHAEGDRIADTVNELRKQRMMMVQGESQFHFLYQILKQQWMERHGLAAAAAAKKDEVVDETIPTDSEKDGGSNL